MKNKKILVVLGGNSKEREISNKTGKACYKAMIKLGYKAKLFDPKKNSFSKIDKKKGGCYF